MTGSLLNGDRLSRYGALGAGGDTVWRQAGQLRAAVAQRYGAEYAAIFAEPRVDEMGGRIDWYAPADGPAVAWRDLDPQTARRAGERLETIRQTLEGRAAELQTSTRSDAERAFGRLLKQALIWPGEAAQWLVGDTPVIAWWGFADPSLAAAPRRAAAPPPPAATAAAASPAASGTVLASAPAIAVERETPWWAIALIALAVLALLFALVWFLRPYMPTIPGLAAYGESQAKAGTTPAPGYDATLKALQEREKQLQAELAALQKQGSGPESCPPAQRGDATTPGGPTGPGGVAIGPGGVVGPDASKGPDAPKGGDTSKGGAVTPPPRPDVAKGPDAAKAPDGKAPVPPKGPDAAKGPQQTPPTTAPPNPQQAQKPPVAPLVVPPEARKSGDVGFMAGEWKSNSDLQTPDGKEVTVNYELDKSGKGKRIVQQGNVRCEAPAQAKFDSAGKLVIEDQADAKCTDGTSFAKGTVICDVAPDGKATCAGQQAGGARYNVQIGR